MCASSWHTVLVHRCTVVIEVLFSSINKRLSRYVTAPQFSIAPAAKSGMARRSDLGSGYLTPNCSSKKGSAAIKVLSYSSIHHPVHSEQIPEATRRACSPSLLENTEMILVAVDVLIGSSHLFPLGV